MPIELHLARAASDLAPHLGIHRPDVDAKHPALSAAPERAVHRPQVCDATGERQTRKQISRKDAFTKDDQVARLVRERHRRHLPPTRFRECSAMFLVVT